MAGLVCFYSALSSGTMGVVAPIAALGVVVPVVLGVASGDTPSPWAWVGMLVAIVGVTLASGPELSGDVSPRPVILAACAAVGFGLALFCLDRGARESTLLTLWGMRLTSVTILVVVALVARTAGGVTARETPALLAIGCGDLARERPVRLRVLARPGEHRRRCSARSTRSSRSSGRGSCSTSGCSACSRSGSCSRSVGRPLTAL